MGQSSIGQVLVTATGISPNERPEILSLYSTLELNYQNITSNLYIGQGIYFYSHIFQKHYCFRLLLLLLLLLLIICLQMQAHKIANI